jgi:predicted naringenin-chalcone synthase
MTGSIVGMGSAWPAPTRQQDLWDGFFAGHFDDQPRAEAIWRNAGVAWRGGVVDPTVEDVSGWGTEARMRRFVTEAVPLGAEAVDRCLADAGLAAADIEQFTVVSCTGYSTPGLDILLAEHLGMGPSTQRLHIGHMGCYAAVPGLASVADVASARGRVGLLLCVELSSLHLQAPTSSRWSPTPCSPTPPPPWPWSRTTPGSRCSTSSPAPTPPTPAT